MRFPHEDRAGELYIDGVSAQGLAEEYDTPLYVMSERCIRQKYRRLTSALSRNYDRIRVLYSAKANTSLSVLRILEQEGAGLDAVSPGEVFLAREAGFTASRILFTGTSVRDDELAYLLGEGVTMNVDSLSQLRRMLRISVPPVVSVRLNPVFGAGHHEHVVTAGESSKFGVWEEDAVKAYKAASDAGVPRFGIQMHIGSGMLGVEPLLRAAERLLDTAGKVRDRVGVEFEFIDLGGGIGVPYEPGEEEFDVDLFSDKVTGLFREKAAEHSLGEPELWFEPGRYLTAEAGVLLTRVNTIKLTPHRRFAGVDAGFNTLLRPAMYGSYHHILVANKLDEPSVEEYDVCGPVCESGDIFARNRPLPRLSEGDLLAILNAGAYGFSMSSQYNSRPRAAEVMVNDGGHRLVRERETFEELLKGQK